MIRSSACQRQADPFPALSGRHGERRSYTTPWDTIEYAVKWLYQAPGLPLEITEEYGNWRQVRDSDGVSGWMHRSLLSSNRTAVIGPWLKEMTALRAQARQNSFSKAELESRVRVQILSCTLSWCNVALNKDHISGFVEKSALWGVYPQEVVN
ncbi:SH3 domain-containing protein [Rhizobium leguminosarum]|uniref:SH3 domain-containing protein n=1 Tax=Rhizobium leguminosarum TaxID=384 RepID=UPI001FDF0EF2|nr:SH3 domain-containing protein [Rhizobium leguminosarum]